MKFSVCTPFKAAVFSSSRWLHKRLGNPLVKTKGFALNFNFTQRKWRRGTVRTCQRCSVHRAVVLARVSSVIGESSARRSRLNSSHEVRFLGTSSTARSALAAQLCERSAGLGGIAARFHQKRFLSNYTRLLEIPRPAFVYWAVKKLNEKSF